MKVLLLNGSANRKGNTFTALSEIAKQLEKNGVESEIMQLGNKPWPVQGKATGPVCLR